MDKQKNKIPAFLPWLVWGLAAGFFFLQYIARITPNVIVPELMDAFSVNATVLGGLSATFFYAYVAMQIPVGMLVDRFGVRTLLIIMTIIAATGNSIFATAHSVHVAEFGRFLMGLASAFGFISAIKLAVVWFPPRRLGMLAGATQALGTLGATIGEIFLTMIVGYAGWRSTTFSLTILFLILSFFIFLIVRDRPPGTKQTQTKTAVPLWQSLKIVLKNPQSWINGIYVAGMYAPTGAFAELWGLTFLKNVHHISTQKAAIAISAIFLGWTLGAPIVGWFSDHIKQRRSIMLVAVILSTVLLSAVLYIPQLNSIEVTILLFLFGVSNTGIAIGYALSSEINPRSIAGTSVSFANMASILIGTILQPLIGVLLDYGWDGKLSHGLRVYSINDYQWAMSTLMITLTISLIAVFFIKETHCKNINT